MNLDQTAISRIENGERAVNDIELLAICEALGNDMSEFFVGLRFSDSLR